jgi:hypothetical protein
MIEDPEKIALMILALVEEAYSKKSARVVRRVAHWCPPIEG